MAELLKNFKPGPLSYYRKLASFDWRKLRIFLETEDIIRYKQQIVNYLKANPICHISNKDLSLDEQRHLAILRVKYLDKSEDLKYINMLDNYAKQSAMIETLFQWEAGTTIKFTLDRGMFPSVIRAMGSKQHADLLDLVDEQKIRGCFALTEVGHGSNVNGMQTRATYDPEKKGFILHTPEFESAKCWSGVLGQCATHAIIYAQLYTADGKHHGLQQFVVQVREPSTHLSLPGVIIADMGAKVGLNAVDNGIVMFNKHFVPKSALLNRNGDVNEQGEYVTQFQDKSKQKGASLAALSNGRINITNICSSYLTKAVTIAVRYAAVRRQFGNENGEEVPILEYQTHQHRLMPYLAGAVILKTFSRYLVSDAFEANVAKFLGTPKPDANERGMEMHAISSGCKPIVAWFVRDGIQECREACAGHGYLKASRLGDLRSDNDANCTYEGENHVLIQQTSNWLIKQAPLAKQNKIVVFPYGSIDFLKKYNEILGLKFSVNSVEELMQPNEILRAYQWLICYLLRLSYEKFERNVRMGQDSFWAKNDNQVYYNRNLAIAYSQHFILHHFMAFINEAQDPNVRKVLTKIFALYALFNLEKHASHLYQGGYFMGEKPNMLLQDSILILCKELKNDAVAIVDAIAPDDFVINSILGHSDGQVYEHLKSEIFQGEGNLSRPKWWADILENTIPSKL